LSCYVIGIAAQIPFLAQTMYTGPITAMLGGADISWIVGLVVTAALYYPLARRTSNPPDSMIYPNTGAGPTESR
jgi:NCS1 family nucleobase:cation symporter-1